MIWSRRAFVTAIVASGSVVRPALALAPRLAPAQAIFDDIAHRTFRYFWETSDPRTGLVPDNWPNPKFASIAAIGMALNAYPIGVERGWITRTAARARVLTTLRFLWSLPQGPAGSGVAGHQGFFYHFLRMEDGLRFGNTELSTVDSALLFAGMLFAAGWFDNDQADEAEIRRLAQALYERADWRWFQRGQSAISMGWHPENGFIARNWDGYNEGMIVYVLALGSPTHAVKPDAWQAWTAPYPRFWRGIGLQRHLAFAPHFGHQYSHIWIDFRGIRDAPMRAAAFDYFENSRRATYAQRAYAMANPMQWRGYSRDIWGLTACNGPADLTRQIGAVTRKFATYAARGPVGLPDGFDDGTIAPTAMVASLPFAPEVVTPSIAALRHVSGGQLYGDYGFYDAFNPSFRFADIAVEQGKVDPQHGWISQNYLGIDEGPMIAMIANHRSDSIWRVMRRSSPIVQGLRRAGFTGGWLERAQ